MTAGEQSPVVSKSVVRRVSAQIDQPADVLSIISRAAADPKTDVVKMAALVEMYERLKAQQAKVAYMAALSRMQPELPLIGRRGEIKNKTGGVQSRYALWEDIVTVTTPILSKHGFALSFRTVSNNGQLSITGVLSHAEGHSEETSLPLPMDTSGSKNDVQAVGSSVSYGKRYTASALLNLRAGEEDDDGQQGQKVELISEAQVADLNALLTETNSDKAKFLTYIKAPSLESIPVTAFVGVVELLKAKRRQV